MPTPTLRDQTVVIIGGNAGMGFATAEGALAEGAKVVIGSSQQANVDAAVARLGAIFPQGAATGHVVDVRDEASL
jgi:NAD(P)-dependent dehydrogenase (short-subunit alcohol dehydrogenase family)